MYKLYVLLYLFIDQMTNTEIHLLNDKSQLHQINLEIEHLLEIFSRFGFSGESFEPISVHVATINLKLSDMKNFYDYKKPKNDFYIHFPSISLIDNTLCLKLTLDPTFSGYMAKLFEVDFGVHIPSFPVIKLKRKWNPITFTNLEDFVTTYKPALTDMDISFNSLMLKNIGWVDKSFTLYPLDKTIFILSETEVKTARDINDITKEDLIKIMDDDQDTETENKDDFVFQLGGATPHSLSVSRAEVGDMEKMFDRFRLWYNKSARRLDFSETSNRSNDSVRDILRSSTKTPVLAPLHSTCNTETQTQGFMSRLNTDTSYWVPQNTKPTQQTEANSSKIQGKRDLLTFVADVHKSAGSESTSINENLDLLTSDDLSH